MFGLASSLVGQAGARTVCALVLVEFAIEAGGANMLVNCAALQEFATTGALNLGSILEARTCLPLRALRLGPPTGTGLEVVPSLPGSRYS